MDFLSRLRPHYHCGPFNPVLDKATGPVDDVCRDHDIAYGDIGAAAYFQHNVADDQFIQRMDAIGGFMPTVYSTVFKGRKLLLPRAPENLSPKRTSMVKLNRGGRLKPPNGKPRPPSSQRLTTNSVQRVSQPAATSYVNHSEQYNVGSRRFQGEEPVLTTWDADEVYPIFINPGDGETWPLLALEAKYRMRYHYKTLALTYRPSVPTTTTGEIGIAWVSDPNTPVPTTLAEILSLSVHAVGPVWSPLQIALPSKMLVPGRTDYLISQSADAEPTLHAPGYFVMISEVANSGRIMCAFDVELSGRNPYPLDLSTVSSLVPLHGARVYQVLLNLTGNGAVQQVMDQAGFTAQTKSPYLQVKNNGTTDSIYALRPGCIRVTYSLLLDNNDVANPEDLTLSCYIKQKGGAWSAHSHMAGTVNIVQYSLHPNTDELVTAVVYFTLLSSYTYPVELGCGFQGTADTQLDNFSAVYEIVEVS